MRRAAGAGDNHLDAAPLRSIGEFAQPSRRPMRRNNQTFMIDREVYQRRRCMLHGFQSDWLP